MNNRLLIVATLASGMLLAVALAERSRPSERPAVQAVPVKPAVSRREHLARLVAETAARAAEDTVRKAQVRPATNPATTTTQMARGDAP